MMLERNKYTRAILSVIATLGIAASSSVAMAKSKAQKTATVRADPSNTDKKIPGQRQTSANASGRASATVIANPITVRIPKDGGEPEVKTELHYTRTVQKDGTITYNFE